jgi:hypothetical protein
MLSQVNLMGLKDIFIRLDVAEAQVSLKSTGQGGPRGVSSSSC